MRTALPAELLSSSTGQKAQKILRNCVHCGFCNATCPTYQLVGDELDGPRGRIYLIKNFLETGQDANTLIHHLDRCLTCRNCETTCPSGVEYSQLVELGRTLGDAKATRPAWFKIKRWAVTTVLSSRQLFALAAWCGRTIKRLLPHKQKMLLGRRNNYVIKIDRQNITLTPLKSTPQPTSQPRPEQATPEQATPEQATTIFLFEGCVQPTLSPQINISARYVLHQLGYTIKTLSSEQCCGAIHLHNASPKQANKRMRHNIGRWQAENNSHSLIVSTASGCGVTLKEYYKTFEHQSDELMTEHAKNFSRQVRDLSEVLVQHKNLHTLIPDSIKQLKIAVHLPCTLQHGMQLKSVFEQLISQLPLQTVNVRDNHLCCGSAGTYSLFQKKLSATLLTQKAECLTESEPDLIITANIGCLLELSAHSPTPIIHWIELFCPEQHFSKEVQAALAKQKIRLTK